ncbi:hypothetical protein NC796_00135 [Aliifodinibius sp. S!AR15-10]|uniref:hypothetical protein n=1 Tax=Aliifodinibius sp. S!AR15-10 TaxID=2950437 RepID=UPI002865C8BB|nr:hypothetical protein [Aliifodinibius sp. S!AR15-10]MDR8389521.1 hypothetical protein [Aliifodinibius sp. S!AR15-10]
MFYFRINRLKIKDNREGRRFIIFGRDLAEVKLFSFISTENVDLPEFDEYFVTNEQARKKEIIKSAVSKVASSRIFTEIENVKDDHILTFGDTGYVLYQTEKIPQDFNWMFLAIESDRKSREIAEDFEKVVEDPEFDKFADNIIGFLSAGPTAPYTFAKEAARFIGKIITKQMKNNKDDLIGILYMSLNRAEHYLHADRKKDGVPDLTNNMYIDYSLFGFIE